MIHRHAVIFICLLALLLGHPELVGAAPPRLDPDGTQGSVSSPLSPDYRIGADGSVTLRICYNWSCSSRQLMTFSPEDMALLKQQTALCPGNELHSRLQRLRIGIWQMEVLARKYQPLLANDLGVNDAEHDIQGRTDCIDNATNTTTFLHILHDLREIPGWSVSSPKIRNRFNLIEVHWTAVVTDANSGEPWSVDSWYRPNGHLPMVMPLPDWVDEKLGWEPPLDRLNPTPHFSYELCGTQQRESLSVTEDWLDSE